jgi:predicted lipid carrier protein YhbT
MSQSGRTAPALSPVLLLGFALRPAPRPPLQAAMSLAMATLLRGHPAVFERLEGLAIPDFLIDPVDLPFRFHLCTALPSPYLRVLGEDEEPDRPVAASIRGPLPALIDLLEGRVDGDALFFSRALAVEGDMAAVVALRNAVDGADISLTEDLLRPLGPLGAPARGLLRAGGALYRRAERDLETLRAALVAPVQRRCDAQEARLRDLDETVAGMPTRRRERQS